MPPGRLSLDYARRLSFEMGRAAVRLELSSPLMGRRRASRLLRLLRLRPLAALWYAARWSAKALPFPGRARHPVGASYHFGRLAQVLESRKRA